MKKHLLIFSLLFVMVGCGESYEERVKREYNVADGVVFKIIKIDSCEYIIRNPHSVSYSSMIHKANCKNHFSIFKNP